MVLRAHLQPGHMYILETSAGRKPVNMDKRREHLQVTYQEVSAVPTPIHVELVAEPD